MTIWLTENWNPQYNSRFEYFFRPLQVCVGLYFKIPNGFDEEDLSFQMYDVIDIFEKNLEKKYKKKV